MKIYTKKGDSGMTSLIGGKRVYKDDLRVEAYGSVDELMAQIAFLNDSLDLAGVSRVYNDDLWNIIENLMSISALLALDQDASGDVRSKMPKITDEDILVLENRIDSIGAGIDPARSFVLPGGSTLVSLCHVCRTVCRRSERACIRASHEYDVDALCLRYLNRLSDYLYILGRKLCEDLNVEERLWVPRK